MSTFDEREKSYENSYAHREKLSFEVEAKCCKLYGLWAAEQLGLNEADADTYAASVIEANLEEAGLEDVLQKVRKDFDAKGIDISDHMMRLELDKALEKAQRMVLGTQD